MVVDRVEGGGECGAGRARSTAPVFPFSEIRAGPPGRAGGESGAPTSASATFYVLLDLTQERKGGHGEPRRRSPRQGPRPPRGGREWVIQRRDAGMFQCHRECDGDGAEVDRPGEYPEKGCPRERDQASVAGRCGARGAWYALLWVRTGCHIVLLRGMSLDLCARGEKGQEQGPRFRPPPAGKSAESRHDKRTSSTNTVPSARIWSDGLGCKGPWGAKTPRVATIRPRAGRAPAGGRIPRGPHWRP